MPELAEVKQDPSMMAKGDDGTVLSPEKKTKSKPCEIDTSLQQRIKSGSLTSTVTDKATNPEEVVLFKLRLSGSAPVISEARKDPNQALAIAAAEKEADQLKLMKTPCIIDIAVSERMKAGSATSTIASKEKDTTAVFKLR
jgi:hypothetical protein